MALEITTTESEWINFQGRFKSSRYGRNVTGTIIMPIRRLFGASYEPYSTQAWIVYTGRFKSGKVKRIKLAVGNKTIDGCGVTLAASEDGVFKMIIENIKHSRRAGYKLSGKYVRTTPSDSGSFSLHEVFDDDDFSDSDSEERGGGSDAIGCLTQ